MKIKVTEKSYEEVVAIPREKHKRPIKPNIFFRTLLKLVSLPDIIATHFKCRRIGMEKLKKNEPALFLMNHSCFLDLEIVPTVLYPRPFNIVATTDAFIGKNWLMRQIGCISTNKFVMDTNLVRDMMHALRKLKSSVVMFPEAGYSFDGRCMPLPDTLGKMVKMMGVPLVTITTYGAYAYDPLYNNLQKRKVKVTADVKYLLSAEEVAAMAAEEIQDLILKEFSFDNFSWQESNKVKISEPFRADCLNRILYKCPSCKAEGNMVGKGEHITCSKCGKSYYLDEYGRLSAVEGDTEFERITDWYDWQRECVKEEVARGEYALDVPVDILMTVTDHKFYRVGKGRLRHGEGGFILTGCDGNLHYEQKPLCSHTVNSDFYFYQIGDMVSIGNNEHLFYCFPEVNGDVVTKIRFAAEEIYKLACAKKCESTK
ncbi:MAG: 1-acyl-sn-glycerol-3-phosphate acyltransferase [Clostridia bacterium]|nr:1-acyl-sn-glycerol-3-phosphate acyltransferase [Clostridia bacterium]